MAQAAPIGETLAIEPAPRARRVVGSVDDEDDTVAALGVTRSTLFDGIERAVRAAVAQALAPTGLTADDCPYIARYLDHYRDQPFTHLQGVMQRYARPESTTAEAWIVALAGRAGAAAHTWSLGRPDPLIEALAPTAERAMLRSRADYERLQVLRAQLGPGAPIPDDLRARLEDSFGRSLGEVRIHVEEAAQHIAGDLGASSFAIGSDIGFARGAFHPGTLDGDALIAHEAAHAVQQAALGTASETGLEREANVAAASALAGQRAPGLSGGGLRLQRCMMPSTAPRDERTIAQVRADLEAQGLLGPRTPQRALPAEGGLPNLPGPTPLSRADQQAIAATPTPLTPAERVLDLGTIEAQLQQLDTALAGRPTGAAALQAARAQLVVARAAITTGDVALWSRRILRTRVVLAQSRRAFANLELASQTLTQEGVPHGARYGQAIAAVRESFDRAVGRALEDDVLDRFQDADRAAANLPLALLDADLAAFGSLSAGAELLQPSIRDIHAWTDRLRPRVAALRTRATQLAEARRTQASNLATLEAQFRDESDGVTLSIEALAYWEQLARGFAAMAGSPPYDMRAIDAIARLMTCVRHMRDADQLGDVALLEVLVRTYREDEDVQLFLRNIHVFVDFSRIALTLGVVLVASIASAGVGAAATAAIGTTTTSTGAIAAFVGVNALEALTFTVVSRGLSSMIPGQTGPTSSFWADLAWNFGLFSVLKLGNLAAARTTASLGVPAFTSLVQHTTAFPLLVGYGAVQQRIVTGEWPTDDEFNRMVTETLIMTAGFAIGTRRFGSSAPAQPRELRIFRERYGLQFTALDGGRQALSEQVLRAALDAPNSPVSAEVTARARILETHLRELVEQVRADPQIRLPELRDAMRGFGSATEAFALQVRLTEAGLTAPAIQAIEAQIEALPELLRDPVRVQLGTGVEYAQRVVSDVAVRRAAIETMARAASNARLAGFEGWVRFSTAQRPGTVPAEQTRNFLDDVAELLVGDAMSRTTRAPERVAVGGDARALVRPGTDQTLRSFDLDVTGGRTRRNVETYRASGRRPVVGDLGTAINHAAEKIIADPSLPADFQTRGNVEAAVVLDWPPPNNVVGGGTIESAADGVVTLVTRDGRRVSQGNFFADYVDTLNGRTRAAAPAGAAQVDVLTVYDAAGTPIYRFIKTGGVWAGGVP